MAVMLSYLPALFPKEYMDKARSYVPKNNHDIVVGVALGGLAIAGTFFFYITFPWIRRGSARRVGITADETVVVIGGGYGTGPVVVKRFRDFLFNVAIVDLRDTDGKELPADSRRMKKNRDKDIIKVKKARERAKLRAVKKGYKINEEKLAIEDTKRDIQRNYTCDPSDAHALEEVKKKIEVDLGHPTIVIWAYTPSLHEVHSLYRSYSNTLSVFLPSLEASPDGGVFMTVCSSLAHIRPAPTHLKPLAEEYKKILDEHRVTEKALKKDEKRSKVKTIMVELGHFDERMINVGLYFPDHLGVLEARAKKQQERAARLDKPMGRGLQLRNNQEKDAMAALYRIRTSGFLMRTTDDEVIAKEIFEAVRAGRSKTLYMPEMAVFWEWISWCPRCVRDRILRKLGTENTVRGLLTCEFTEGEEGLLVGLETDISLEVDGVDESDPKHDLKVVANSGTVLNLPHERKQAPMGSVWASELKELKKMQEEAVKMRIREEREKDALLDSTLMAIARLERKVKPDARDSMTENN